MPGDRRPLLLDASVWFAAAHSPTGGSALVLEICQGARYRAVTSQLVLLEALRNLQRKSTPESVARFYRLLAAARPEMLTAPTEAELAAFSGVTAIKDRYLLGLAREAGVRAVITLDRHHLLTDEARAALAPIPILNPGEFLARARAEAETTTPELGQTPQRP